MPTAGTEWLDEDIQVLIDGKVSAKTYSQIAFDLGNKRTPKACDLKWQRVKEQIAAGESPFESGVIVDPATLERAAWSDEEGAFLPPPEGLEMTGEGNTMFVDSRSRRIRTLDQLIEACDIDLDIWNIERHVINKWEVGAKFGPKGEEEIIVEPLFQVKAWMVLKHPVALEPVVSPALVTVRPAKIAKQNQATDEIKRLLALPDPPL